MSINQKINQEVKRLVKAGEPASLETVDFSDPNRPKTCLEVDFPILPVNQVAIIEGNAGKPIYQMSKWWARRRSSVFRAMLIAAATKAPLDSSLAAKTVWDCYYSNHKKNGAFNSIKVADIFMGGGTTLVEGSRLGMEMVGNDLNPVAWFVVKQEFSDVNIEEVNALLDDIENEVKPQIIPFFYCDGPNGEKGKWRNKLTGKVEGSNFDPLLITPEDRINYSYEGPEIIYTFWAKHGPCNVSSCKHRTPIFATSVIATKTFSVKYWKYSCSCGHEFDIEDSEVRMAPDVPLYISPSENEFVTKVAEDDLYCPACQTKIAVNLKSGESKKVNLTLLLNPQWIAGSPNESKLGINFGGAPQDNIESTLAWNDERARTVSFLEVRGELSESMICQDSGNVFLSGKNSGTVPKSSHFTCSNCGKQQRIATSIAETGKGGQYAGYAIQGFAPERAGLNGSYNGRFFAPFSDQFATQYNQAVKEWEARKVGDLANYWPKSEVPDGMETKNLGNNHGLTHWWTMFNPRQLLVLTQILKSIMETGSHEWKIREYVLGAFQQYLRNQNMFCFWNPQRDSLEPLFANNRYRPKGTVIENSVFPKFGRGNWNSACKTILSGLDWIQQPWEIVSKKEIEWKNSVLSKRISGKSIRVKTNDSVESCKISQGSSTELRDLTDESIDLIITDPPFSGLLNYAELADFFHVWLSIPLSQNYPEIFDSEFTPKVLEAVSNEVRVPEDPEGYYKRILTQCWLEAKRILKSSGILAFTFHHSADEPWITVLESLFDAGFYLEATYPIRSDESKGEGQFGAQKIEFDIIHVCRKRENKTKRVSWAHLRREIISDIRQIEVLLKNHSQAGLPDADLQVIRRGKALEYFSQHYGQVFTSEDNVMDLKNAIIGINQVIDEDSTTDDVFPPTLAEPFTRQFLRIFDGQTLLARDQLQKYLRGSGISPQEFVARGWVVEKNREFHLIDPLVFAKQWSGKHRRNISNDLDQILLLVGACFDGSGLNVMDILKNPNFEPHPSLTDLLLWMRDRGQTGKIRNAATRAISIYSKFVRDKKANIPQPTLFEGIIYEKSN